MNIRLRFTLFQYKSSEENTMGDSGFEIFQEKTAVGRKAARHLLLWAAESAARLSMLETVWPTVLHDLTRDALADFAKPNYGKILLDKIKSEMHVNK